MQTSIPENLIIQAYTIDIVISGTLCIPKDILTKSVLTMDSLSMRLEIIVYF